MSPGQTAERVYTMLKAQIMSGEFRPGERLDPARLAQELNASVTPVRDALHQLLGEHMVHAYPLRGFEVPALNETSLRDLYLWVRDLLAILLRARRGQTTSLQELPHREGVSDGDHDVVDRSASLFDTIAAALGTSEHQRAIRHANDRLHRVRILETAVLDDVGSEVDRLVTAWGARDLAALRMGLERYHRRRLAALPALGIAIARRAV